MLSLLLAYFVVCSLSQTYLILDGNKLTIKNVIIGDGTERQDLIINPNTGQSFNVHDTDYGKYVKHLGNNDLEFSKKNKYSLYDLQEEIQNKQVKYNGKQIQPTFSYMIAAHGGEYRKLHTVYKGSELLYGAHGGEFREAAPDSEQKKTWEDSKSTIYFFDKQWTYLDSC